MALGIFYWKSRRKAYHDAFEFIQQLATQYHQRLGLPITLSVDTVDFSSDGKQIEIHARFTGGAVFCQV
jgi:hypothetical protein